MNFRLVAAIVGAFSLASAAFIVFTHQPMMPEVENLHRQKTVSILSDRQSDIIASITDTSYIVTRQQYESYLLDLQLFEPNEVATNQDEIVKQILVNQLLVDHAKQLGLMVTNEELNNGIDRLRSALNAKGSELWTELYERLVSRSSFEQDSYWESKLIREQYRQLMLKTKLATQLEPGGFRTLQEELYAAYAPNIHINYDELARLNVSK